MSHSYPDYESNPERSLGNLKITFEDYLNAMIYSDITEMRYAANLLPLSLPFAEAVQATQLDLEYDSDNDPEIKEDVLYYALRSYVYSGIRISRAHVFKAAKFIDKDDGWLYRTIKPDADLLAELKSEGFEDTKEMKRRGHKALRELGLIRWPLKHVIDIMLLR